MAATVTVAASYTTPRGTTWFTWFVDLNGGHVTEGMAHDLDTATATAEDKARQLAGGHAGDPKPGGT